MERPVRSFRSFIRTAPPTPECGSEKPLRPISPAFASSSSSATALFLDPSYSETLNTHSSWRAPTEWEWEWENASPLVPATSIFPIRTHSPLLPDRYLDDFDMEPESGAYYSVPVTMPQALLHDLERRFDDRPEPPPRNPSRLSHVRSRSDITASGSSASSLSEHGDLAITIGDGFHRRSTDWQRLRPTMPCTWPTDDHPFHARTQTKAFKALGILLPTSTQDKTERIDSPQADDGPRSDLCVRHPTAHSCRRSICNEYPEETTLHQTMHRLSVSQDYHDVLVTQYHEVPGRVRGIVRPPRQTSAGRHNPADTKGPGLFPRPLTWSKEFGSSTDSLTQRKLQNDTALVSRPAFMHKRNNTWTSQHQLIHPTQAPSDDQARTRSASETRISQRSQHPGMEVDTLLRQDIAGSDLMTYTKGLRSQRKRRKGINLESTLLPSSPQISNPALSSPCASMNEVTPVLRLPGGFALVRHLPCTKTKTTESQDNESSPLASPTQQPRGPSSSISSLESLAQPSSWPSKRLQTPVAPAVAVKSPHPTFTSPPSSRPQSSNPSPPTSPLAYEVLWAPTPPLPVHDDAHRRRFLKRARTMRETWKRHRRDAKQRELKQSIKLVGLVDSGATWMR